MKFSVEIEIMPRKELLDPQGKTVGNGLHNIGFRDIDNVRIGKCIMYQSMASTDEDALKEADSACRKLLANPVMESYSIKVSPIA